MTKKWSCTHRLWHWVNAVVVFIMLLTGLFIQQEGVLEELFKRPHIIVGFCLCGLVPLRALRARFFGDRRTLDEARHFRTQVLARLKDGSKFTRADFHLFHKAGVKNGYLGVYALLAGIALTGITMVAMFQMGTPEATRDAVKEVHEVLFILLAIFVPLHIGGVVYAENTDEPNITSDMIHGGKE